MARSWEERYDVASDCFVPWLGEIVSLEGRRVIDFGAGSGSFALALAPHVESVLCLDESDDAIVECRDRARHRGISNVDARSGSFQDLSAEMSARRGKVDIVTLFAVLEHMTLRERLRTLHLAADVLAPDGVIVVAETPNRLLWNDHHTTQTPFFGLLPDELVLDLAGTIRRSEIASVLDDDARTVTERQHVLTRFGRGASFHEFEAVFGPSVHEHIVGSGWDPPLQAERPEQRDELYLAKFLLQELPHVASCFSRYWLDLVIRPGACSRVSLPTPWTPHSLNSEHVTITPWDTAIVHRDSVLRPRFPAAASAVAINVVVDAAHGAAGPVIDVRHGGGASTLRLPEHRPGNWIRQAIVAVSPPTDTIEITTESEDIEVTSVLHWPVHEPGVLDPLPRSLPATADHEQVAADASRSRAGASADGLHGTYVGNGRVLVRLRAGGRLLVSSDDLSLMPELVAEGGYDAPFTAFLGRTLPADAVVVDVGANVGLFTVIGALCAPHGRVIAYEPAVDLLPFLRDNVLLNWLDERVTIRPVGVAERAGHRPFSFDEHAHVLGGIAAQADATTATIETVCLDEDLRDVGPIDLVKIDVEGGDAQVLEGMGGLIASGRVRAISCEVRKDAFARHGRMSEWSALAATLHRLEAAGWTFALIAPDGSELSAPVAEIIDSEPHPNVIGRPPVSSGGAG